MITRNDVVTLLIYISITTFCIFNLIIHIFEPISTEAVQAKLMTISSDITVGNSEIFGHGVALIIAGNVVYNYDIEYTMYLALEAKEFTLIFVCFLKKKAPRLTN